MEEWFWLPNIFLFPNNIVKLERFLMTNWTWYQEKPDWKEEYWSVRTLYNIWFFCKPQTICFLRLHEVMILGNTKLWQCNIVTIFDSWTSGAAIKLCAFRPFLPNLWFCISVLDHHHHNPHRTSVPAPSSHPPPPSTAISQSMPIIHQTHGRTTNLNQLCRWW